MWHWWLSYSIYSMSISRNLLFSFKCSYFYSALRCCSFTWNVLGVYLFTKWFYAKRSAGHDSCQFYGMAYQQGFYVIQQTLKLACKIIMYSTRLIGSWWIDVACNQLYEYIVWHIGSTRATFLNFHLLMCKWLEPFVAVIVVCVWSGRLF